MTKVEIFFRFSKFFYDFMPNVFHFAGIPNGKTLKKMHVKRKINAEKFVKTKKGF